MNELELLAREAARKYGLDPRLICALCKVESSWIPTAQRHEAGYGCLIGFTRAPLDGNPTNEMRFTDANSYTWRADTKKLAKFGGVVIGDRATILTELLNQQTSVGLMQFMFATARERGLQGRFAELFDPAVNLEWGCRHLRWMIDHNNAYGLPDPYRPTKPEDLAAAWNGGKARLERCPICGGCGQSQKPHRYTISSEFPVVKDTQRTCEYCHGTGKAYVNEDYVKRVRKAMVNYE